MWVSLIMKGCMALVSIYILMEVDMKVIGSKMCKKEWVKKFGLMGEPFNHPSPSRGLLGARDLGSEYIGKYKNGLKHGFGKYKWPDKSKF